MPHPKQLFAILAFYAKFAALNPKGEKEPDRQKGDY